MSLQPQKRSFGAPRKKSTTLQCRDPSGGQKDDNPATDAPFQLVKYVASGMCSEPVATAPSVGPLDRLNDPVEVLGTNWEALAAFPTIAGILKNNPCAYPVLLYPTDNPGNHGGMWYITPYLDMLSSQYIKLWACVNSLMKFSQCVFSEGTEIGHPWFAKGSLGEGGGGGGVGGKESKQFLTMIVVPHLVIHHMWKHTVREGSKGTDKIQRQRINKLMLTCGFRQKQSKTEDFTTEFVFDTGVYQSNAYKMIRGGRRSSANQKTLATYPIGVLMYQAMTLFECFKAIASKTDLKFLQLSNPPYLQIRDTPLKPNDAQAAADLHFASFMP